MKFLAAKLKKCRFNVTGRIVVAASLMIFAALGISFVYFEEGISHACYLGEMLCKWVPAFFMVALLLVPFSLALRLVKKAWLWYATVILASFNALAYFALAIAIFIPSSACKGAQCFWAALLIVPPTLLLILSVFLLFKDKSLYLATSIKTVWKHMSLLFIPIIVGFLAIGLTTGYSDPFYCWGECGYNPHREQIEAAVYEFMQRPTDPTYNHTTGDVPIVNNKSVIAVNGTMVVQGEEYYVVAVCPLLESSSPPGILKLVPEVVHPRNCLAEGANAKPGVVDCAVDCTGSYIWLTTINGDIASICIGAECEAHGEDGYEGVYP